MNWKRLVFVLVLSLMLIVGSTVAAAAKSPASAPTATLLVTGLEELQGSTVGPDGALFVEVGDSEHRVREAWPRIPFTWLDFAHGGGGIFLLSRAELDTHHATFSHTD